MRSESLLKSFQYAIAGIVYVVRTQRNARLHLAAFAIVMTFAAWLRLPALDWALLVLMSGIVFAAEIANTVIETIVDLVSPDYHELAGRAKDVAAGGVLCMAITAGVVGVILLGPPALAAIGG